MKILLPTLIKGWTIALFFVLPVQAQYSFQWQLGSEATNSTLLNFPADVSIDAEGNIYVADAHNHRIQKFTADGTFLTKFGSKGSGDGHFNNPLGISIDVIGNIYVADRVNHRIQIFSADGSFISKFGSLGSGDGQFNSPSGIAVDKVGNIYVADTDNHRIQKFTGDGTFLSKFGSKGSEDGQFGYPIKVSLDVEGNVYVADGNNHRIQKFTADGTFLFKYGSYGGSPEDGEIYNPQGIAVDAEGNVYVADAYNHRIQKFAPDGTFISKFGSLGTVEGQFSHPMGVTVDREGNIYVADSYNNRIQKFTGNSSFLWQTGIPISNGLFSYPHGIAVDTDGNVYVVDTRKYLIQKFSADGTFLSKFGSESSGDERLSNPCGVAVDREGNIFVVDQDNNCIKKFAADGTFLSKFGSKGSEDGQFGRPIGIGMDTAGNIYVADTYNSRIQKFSADGAFISKFGSLGYGDGQLVFPYGVTVDIEGNIYVADTKNHRIQKFAADGTFLSKFGSEGSGDEQFNDPYGMAVDREGNIFVVDQKNHRVQMFASDGSFLSNIGSYGANNGEFYYPQGITIDAKGNIYVADTYNYRIQKFSLYPRAILYADSVSGYPEKAVEVQVRANDFVDIISAQATLEWDPQVAELLKAEAGALSQVQFNTQTANQGKMTFSWYESSDAEGLSLPDSAVLFTLRFRLIGKPKAKTALSFTSSLTPLEFADKEEKIVKVTTQAGKVYILPLQTLSGRILTEASQAVKDVEVKLSGYASAVDSTDAEGKYQLSGIHPYKSYSITASKDHNAIFANGLTSLDLAILQRHILETELLASPYKLLAADVDLSQSITTADIKDVQDVVLGNRDRLAKGKHWTFIPKRFVFEDPAYPYPFDTAIVFDTVPVLSGHDFVAIKLGDVNDTWDPAKGRLQQKQLKFFVEQHETFSHGTLTVPVRVADFKDVSSFQLTLEWDKEILVFESAQGDALPDVIFGEKYAQEGQLTVLWYNRQGSSSSLSDEQAVFTVNFQAVGKTGEQSAVSLSSARTPLLAYDAANVLMKTEITAGVVEITEAFNPARPTVYNLHQNEPNPFTDEVRLKFALPQKSKVNLKVMNASGQVFFQTEDTFDQGTHAISWDGRTAQGATLNPGVYFLQLTAGSFQETIKIIKK